MAQTYTLDAVAKQLSRPETDVNNVEVLLSAFKVYNAHRYGVEAKRATMMLLAAYQRLCLPQVGVLLLVLFGGGGGGKERRICAAVDTHRLQHSWERG